VVFVFVFNSQSMNGVETVASELHDRENKTLQALKRWPTLHFLPSRKELSEQKKLRDWEVRAKDMFGRFCDSQPIRAKYGDQVIEYVRALSIPYVPYFAYGEELAAKTDLGLEICQTLEKLIDLLLQEKAETAAAMAASRAQETRSFLSDRLAAVVGALGLTGLAAIAGGLYGFWKGYSVAEMLAPIVGDLPLAQLAATLLIGALCGAGSALIPVMERDDALRLDPRRFWSLAGVRALVGALIGVTCAALFQTNRFFPLISFVAPLVAAAIAEGIKSSFGETSPSRRSR
jgi:hypothetical protein